MEEKEDSDSKEPQAKTFPGLKTEVEPERREKSLAQWNIWASLTWKIFLVFWNP